jgi:pimeloyl-ACP methyl ester carboxylesterase/quercetin dioxygenase-like cupin family protein
MIVSEFRSSSDRRFKRLAPIVWAAFMLCIPSEESRGHDELDEKSVRFSSAVADVAGTLTYPHRDASAVAGQSETPETKLPCVLIVGGTLSNTSDGGMNRPAVPPRDALARLARALAAAGYASLRYDKVGQGESKPRDAWRSTYSDEAVVAASALEFLRKQGDFGPLAVAGESAGAYLACLAAKSGSEADAYVFLGGHCDSGEAIYRYNFGRLVELADRDPEWRAVAEKDLRFELALGRRYREMFEAAKAGKSEFEIVDGGFRRRISLTRRKEELDMPPDEMYRHIKKPSLAISGELDLNVPPDHAARIVAVLRRSGNHASTCVMIPGADHSFQIAPQDEATRLRERYTFESFRREYSPRLYQELIAWLDDTLGRKPSTSTLPRDVAATPLPVRAVERSERDPKSASSPERLHLAPGIQIVEDITDKQRTVGVHTLEGQIGPLLLGEDCQAHFIDMPAGMYCEEHPHNSESIIYTVRGKWVLCSNGRRQVMKPGTLFHFARNTPTGYEVPFDSDALILIFKGQRLTQKESEFIDYLKGLAKRLEREHQAGVPYLLKDLPADHPAIKFANSMNKTLDNSVKD